MGIKIGKPGIHIAIGRGGVAKPNGAPSGLTLTVISSTEINGSFTIGSTNQDGHYVYMSSDGGLTYSIKVTLTGSTTIFQAIGLTAGTLYYFYMVAFKGSQLSSISNIASDSTIPNPDALFDTRTGLDITDSIGGQIISISHFPFLNAINKTGLAATIAIQTDTAMVSGGAWTNILIFQSTCVNSGAITNYAIAGSSGNRYVINFNGAQAYFYLGTTQKNVWLPTVLPDWYAVIFRYTGSSVGRVDIYKMGASGTKQSSTWSNASSNGVEKNYIQLLKDVRVANIALYAHYPSYIADIDCNALVDSFTIPPATAEIFLPFGFDENVSRKFYNSITRKEMWLGGTSYTINTNVPDLDHLRYLEKPYGKAFLTLGYSRSGSYMNCYQPNGTKGTGNYIDDIEYLTTDCIHNMANSYLNFSGIVDVTIKNIFDKSNTTYWKTSIQSQPHYVDAGGGYYGLWHPIQLQRDFIITHAHSGHENHIFASLRISGTVITGITALRVYKTNLT